MQHDNDEAKDQEEAARQHPAQAVDEMEERVFGGAESGTGEPEGAPEPAIEQDLEREELGSAAAGDEPSG